MPCFGSYAFVKSLKLIPKKLNVNFKKNRTGFSKIRLKKSSNGLRHINLYNIMINII